MRPTFARNLWILILLGCYIVLIKCIKPTDQQIIARTFHSAKQKSQELVDTNHALRWSDEITSSSAEQREKDDEDEAISANYKSQNQGVVYGHATLEDTNESYEQQVEMPQRQRCRQHNLSDRPQVNSDEDKHESSRRTNAEAEGNALSEPPRVHHCSDGQYSSTRVPVQAPVTPHIVSQAKMAPSHVSPGVRNRPIGASSLRYHNKVALAIASDSGEYSSSSVTIHRGVVENKNSNSNRVRRSVTSDVSSYEDAALAHPSPPLAHQTKFNSIKTMAAVNESFTGVNGQHPSDDISKDKDQSVAFSSGDISKSDIRYNNNSSTLLSRPHYSKTSSVSFQSQSETSSSSHPTKAVASSSLLAPSPSLSLLASQNADDISLLNLPSSTQSESQPQTRPVLENMSNVNYRKSRDKDDIGDSKLMSDEQIIIIDDGGEEFENANSNDYIHDEPRALPLRPIIRGPYDDESGEEMTIQYADQHSEKKLMCEVDLDTVASVWFKNGQIVETVDRNARPTDYRFIREPLGGLTIRNVMLEDDGKWQCRASNANSYEEDARPVKLVVLDRPKAPYLLIDSRRLDAGNIFVPVKENSELNLACISEGGNPKPTLTWEVLLSPGVDRHAQKVAAEVLELEEMKNDKDKGPYKINSGAKSEARLPAVYRAHHNARILCVMEHPTLKMRQNASLLLDVQYTPSFAISRIPGFGYPLREGIEVSLKCDVDSNPPSTPIWQKDDGETPVPQTGDGFLNFTSIRREHSGWYKCSSRHLNFQYSSIGYYLSVRYDSVDVTSEPDDQEVSVAASHNPNKGQLEVQLGGAVTLQCPQGSLGCWSHLDPVTARLRGLGVGLNTPTGQFSLKDVVYQDAGTYKCIGQSTTNKKKLEVLQTIGLYVKGAPTAIARNATPVAYPGSPLHLSVEFCANPPAYAARWLHGDRVYTPGNQYGSTVLAYAVTDLPTPFCKEARLTYVSMHERVPRTFYFIVSSPGGVAEAMFKVNFTLRYKTMSNSVDEEEEELSEPEEIHFPVFGSSSNPVRRIAVVSFQLNLLLITLLCIIFNSRYVLL